MVILDIKNEQLNNDNDFEIVHTSLRRRAEESSEQIFETEHFTAIAKGYIVEKYIPDVAAKDISIPDITFEEYKPRHPRQEIQEKEDDDDDDDDVIIVAQDYKKKIKF